MEEFEDKPDDDLLFTQDINEPYLINWNNFKHSPKEKIRRRGKSVAHFAFITGLIILFMWLFYNVYIANTYDLNNPFLSQSSNCPRAITIKQAYENELLPDDQRQENVMLCFCRQKFHESNAEFIKTRETYFNNYRADNNLQ